MDSIYTDTLYGSNNECARTNAVFLPISDVCNGTVSLLTLPASELGFFLLRGFPNYFHQVTLLLNPALCNAHHQFSHASYL